MPFSDAPSERPLRRAARSGRSCSRHYARTPMVDTAGYLMVGVAAALVTFVATPIVGSLARPFGWVVQPDERRVHSRPTPDVGGIAMFCGFLAAMGLALCLHRVNALLAL